MMYIFVHPISNSWSCSCMCEF